MYNSYNLRGLDKRYSNLQEGKRVVNKHRPKLKQAVSEEFKNYIEDCKIPIYLTGEREVYSQGELSPDATKPSVSAGTRVDYNTNAFLYRMAKKLVEVQGFAE